MRPVVLDCTELVQNPVRTGIQRVVREVIKNWPDDAPPLRVARFVPGSSFGLQGMSPAAVGLLSDRDPRALSMSTGSLAKLINEMEPGAYGKLPDDCTYFVPEIFYDTLRTDFYEWKAESRRNDLAILCFDFLPFLRPDLFNLRTVINNMHYLRALRNFGHVAHISEETRLDYHRRIRRSWSDTPGIVLPLGADGIAVERQTWNTSRRQILTVGSIDGRKNQKAIAMAVVELRAAGCDVELTIIGRAFENQELQWLQDVTGLPGIHWTKDASDGEIAKAYRTARATAYISRAEGFGLPPVESLLAGIPVIAHHDIPSLNRLDRFGQVRIDAADPEAIKAAILQIMDDGRAEGLWRETGRLELPTWKGFGRSTSDWIASIQ